MEIVRYAGSDRYAMSIEMAQALVDAEDGTSGWVVLASGESWADAVMAGPLAASFDAPVVPVPFGGLQALSARIEFGELLRSTGARRVMIVGSGIVLPDQKQSVLFGLGMLPRNIEHVHGSDPIEAAIAVAARIGTPAEFSDLGPTVVISSDRSVADAVAVGPLAAAGPFPLLITAPDALDPRIAEYLAEHDVSNVVLVGGTTAIAPTVQESLEATGVTVTRLAGRDRIDTARLAADLFDQHNANNPACADVPARIGLAPTQYPEHALFASPLLARSCAPLRYAEPDQLSLDLRNTLYLARQQPRGAELLIFGGESAIADVAADVALPPVRLAFVSVGEVTDGDKHITQIAVANEDGAVRLYSQTEVEIPAWSYSSSESWCELRDLAWSPSGRYLSYRRLCTPEIFVLDIETGESYQVDYGSSELTFQDAAGIDPLWSPDGRAFVFTTFVDDPATGDTWRSNSPHLAELFVHDAESRTTRRLTNNTVHDLGESWSPDSNTVTTLQHWHPDVSDQYYRSPRSYAFTRVGESETASRDTQCGVGPGATWSPHGRHLAYYQWDGWWTRQVTVWTSGSTARRQLTPVGCSACTEDHQHHGARILGWNRSGSMLAFSDTDFARRDGEFDYESFDFQSETTASYVLDVASGEVTKLFEFTHETCRKRTHDPVPPSLRLTACFRPMSSNLRSAGRTPSGCVSMTAPPARSISQTVPRQAAFSLHGPTQPFGAALTSFLTAAPWHGATATRSMSVRSACTWI